MFEKYSERRCDPDFLWQRRTDRGAGIGHSSSLIRIIVNCHQSCLHPTHLYIFGGQLFIIFDIIIFITHCGELFMMAMFVLFFWNDTCLIISSTFSKKSFLDPGEGVCTGWFFLLVPPPKKKFLVWNWSPPIGKKWLSSREMAKIPTKKWKSMSESVRPSLFAVS